MATRTRANVQKSQVIALTLFFNNEGLGKLNALTRFPGSIIKLLLSPPAAFPIFLFWA